MEGETPKRKTISKCDMILTDLRLYLENDERYCLEFKLNGQIYATAERLPEDGEITLDMRVALATAMFNTLFPAKLVKCTPEELRRFKSGEGSIDALVKQGDDYFRHDYSEED